MILYHSDKYLSTNINLSVAGEAIQRVDQSKFLGVLIDEKLTWQNHISQIRKRIRSGLYSLNMANHILSVNNLRTLYFSLIHPHLTYCNLIWGTAAKTHLRPLEVQQKRAVRIINHSPYNAHTSAIFKKLNIPKLADINQTQQALLLYKNANNTLPVCLNDMFIPNSECHSYQTRHRDDIHFQKARLNIVHNSFIHSGPKIWFGLPPEIKAATSQKSFDSHLKRRLMSLY